ncbi:probable UDP-sugar transporter protein SLC35A5 isoform X1 [Lates japonicus]|uniref:Probable UDP-sugar transporter protein SLC35A5 isoform X1 n=1 Tax=Lates japonicus TaxID=270547 RepID=A0AAD3NGI5_LATJO|nr:probable UDP-sugar transporter protein SLC35A5 isoform X1 [Lates japonicus]
MGITTWTGSEGEVCLAVSHGLTCRAVSEAHYGIVASSMDAVPTPGSALVTVTALGLSVAFILKFRDNMFHADRPDHHCSSYHRLSLFLFDFRPLLILRPHGPAGSSLSTMPAPKDLESTCRKPRVINGEVF